MTLTLDLPQNLQTQLREEAAKAGMAESDFVLNTLQERLGSVSSSVGKMPPRLSSEETTLLLEINRGLPEETAQEYRELLAKRRAETLTPEEHARLLGISDTREIANARRLEKLMALADLRHTTVEALMNELGIRSLWYL